MRPSRLIVPRIFRFVTNVRRSFSDASLIHVDMGVGAFHCGLLASDKPIGIIRKSHFILKPTPATESNQIIYIMELISVALA